MSGMLVCGGGIEKKDRESLDSRGYHCVTRWEGRTKKKKRKRRKGEKENRRRKKAVGKQVQLRTYYLL